MNRCHTLIDTPLATVTRFDHPCDQRHQDPSEEVADDLSIGLVERGRFSVQIGRNSWELGPGDLFLTFPGMVYHTRHPEPVPTDVCVSVGYADACDETRSFIRLARRLPVIRSNNRVAYLFRAFSHPPAWAPTTLAAEEAAAALLSEVCTASEPGRKPFSPPQLAWYAERVDATRKLLEVRFATDHSLTSLARSVGVSPFHFARVFRELVGVPPHRYLLHVRMNEASSRLRGGASVTDACFSAGFHNLSHFIRLFQRRYGLSPARYARRFPS